MPSKNDPIHQSAVLTIGDELIYGERSNENSQWMLNWLRVQNQPASIALSLADDANLIAYWLKKLKADKHSPILVSGGIGGTHDDCTRDGIAQALDLPISKHAECWEILNKRYRKELNTSRANMAMLPEGCTLIPNPHGAPGFHLQGIFAFPGFPKMLQAMVSYILPELDDSPKTETMTQVEFRLKVPEGDVSDAVRLFSNSHPEARLGIYAHSGEAWGQTTLRFRYPVSRHNLLLEFQEFIKSLNAPVLHVLEEKS